MSPGLGTPLWQILRGENHALLERRGPRSNQGTLAAIWREFALFISGILRFYEAVWQEYHTSLVSLGVVNVKAPLLEIYVLDPVLARLVRKVSILRSVGLCGLRTSGA
jgi:hypothetical protein